MLAARVPIGLLPDGVVEPPPVLPPVLELDPELLPVLLPLPLFPVEVPLLELPLLLSLDVVGVVGPLGMTLV